MMNRETFQRLWKRIKKTILILFIAQLVYIVLLKWVNPPVTLTQIGSLVTGNGLKRDYVSPGKISPNAKLAVIAAEDQLFADHNGFDWKSIQKAMKYNEKKPGRVRGASTISQQTAKNVFLWQGRSWIRKGFEVYFTFMIELVWGKKRILDVYLNVIETGDGIFGIEKAAQIYFHKPASDLSRQEAALIAACLPNPVKMKAQPASSYVQRRSGTILRYMRNLDGDAEIKVIIENKKPQTAEKEKNKD